MLELLFDTNVVDIVFSFELSLNLSNNISFVNPHLPQAFLKEVYEDEDL